MWLAQIVYYDGQFDDARLNVALACTAAGAGAAVLNHAKVMRLLKVSHYPPKTIHHPLSTIHTSPISLLTILRRACSMGVHGYCSWINASRVTRLDCEAPLCRPQYLHAHRPGMETLPSH